MTPSHRYGRPHHLLIQQYNESVAKYVIHVSEAYTANDFAALVVRVRAGAKVITENGQREFVIRVSPAPQTRSHESA